MIDDFKPIGHSFTCVDCGQGGLTSTPGCDVCTACLVVHETDCQDDDRQLTENHFGGHVSIEIQAGEDGVDLYVHNRHECHGLHMHFPTRRAAREWLIDAWLRLEVK